MKGGERLAALEGLRGYAAFLIFLVHAFGLLAFRLYGIDPDHHAVLDEREWGPALVVLLARSHYGVDLFFVLSGLLMADLAMRRWPGTGPFLARRWLRIYPAYLASALLVMAISWAWLDRGYGPAELAGNALLLQGFFGLGIPPVNPVTWSLTYEAAFYLAVPALAGAWRRYGPPSPASLALAFVLVIAIPAWLPGGPAYLGLFALFVPGVAMGLLGDAEREAIARRIPLGLALAAWAAFALAMKLGTDTAVGSGKTLAAGVAAGLLVLKACEREGPLARALASPVPRWLGRYSYSFFLVHYIVVHRWSGWVSERVPPADRAAHALVFLAGALAISLAASVVLWNVAERFYFRRPAAGAR